MAQFATVAAITGNGTVLAVDVQGKTRALKVGDALQKGETVRTVGDVRIELIMEDGHHLAIAPAQSVRLDDNVAESDQRPTAQDSAVTTPATADTVIQALERGTDLNQSLEATAAGLAPGGGVDGGSTFVQLLRIAEGVTPQDYNYNFVPPELLPDVQVIPEPAVEPAVSVGVTVGTQVGIGEGGPGLITGDVIHGTVSTADVIEGSSGGSKAVTFLITLDKVSTTDVTVTYTIVPGTASNPADFFDGAATGTVTIPAGYIGFFVTENIVGDILVEGNETFTIVLSNPIGATLINDTATVTIIDDDHAPVAVDDSNSLTEDQISVSGNVLPNDTDADGQTLSVVGPSITVTNAFGTLVIDSATGAYTFTVNEATQAAAQALDDGESINMVFPDVYRVTDGANLSNLADVTITITGTNDVPTISVDPGNEGGNDVVYEAGLAIGSNAAAGSEFASGTFTVSDADGLDDIQSVTINGVTVAIGSLVGQSFAGTNGTLTVTAYSAGVASYTYELTSPTTDAAGTESDVFTLTTSDGTGTSAPAAITIEIIDDVPTAFANSNSVAEGAVVGGNVLTDGTDDVFGADGAAAGGGVVGVRVAGGDTTTAVQTGVNTVIAGSFGTLTLQANGSYSYDGSPNVVPPAGATDTFVYTIKDGDGDLSTTTLTITLTDAGLVASNDDITVNEAALATGSNPSSTAETAAGTLVGNVSGGAGGYSYALTSPAAGSFGTLTLNADGSYSYTLTQRFDTSPDANNGTNTENNRDTFTYQATDANGNTVTSTITVDIVDDVPTASNEGTVTVNEGSSVGGTFDFVAGADGASITSVNGVAPVGGTITVTTGTGQLVVNAATGAYTYTANSNTSSQPLDNFTFTVTDGDGDTTTGTVSFDSLDANTPTGGTTAAFVDDDGLSGGNPASTTGDINANQGGDSNASEAIYTGTLALSFGGDGAGTVNFASLNGTSGTVGTETVNYTWSGSTLTAIGPRGELFHVVVNQTTGAYTLTLVDNVLQAAGNNETSAPVVGLTYTVTDSDGSSTTGTLNVTFNDDAPTASNEGTVTVNEGSSVGGTFDFVAGADGASITSINGVAPVGGTITVTTGTGQLVVNAATGAYTYTANSNTSSQPLDNFTFTVTDGDGDTTTGTVSFDSLDANTPTGGTTAAFVDDDGLSGGNPASTTGDINANQGGDSNASEAIYAGTLALSFGGDGAGTVNFASLNGTSGTVGTETVNYTWSGSTLTATGPRGELFHVVVNQTTGAYTLTLVDNVLQAAGNNETSAPVVGLTYTVTDSDGSSTTGTLNVTFNDDAPTFTQIDYGIIANQAGVLSGTHDMTFGADGEGVINLSALTSLSGVNYSAVQHNLDGSTTITAGTGASTTNFFALTINPDGTYEFDLIDPRPSVTKVADFGSVQGGAAVPSLTLGTGADAITFTGLGGDQIKPTSAGFGVNDGNLNPGDDFSVTFAGNQVDSVSFAVKQQSSSDFVMSWSTDAGDAGLVTFGVDGSFTINPLNDFSTITFNVTGGNAKVDSFSYSQNLLPAEQVLQFSVSGTDGDGDLTASQTLNIQLLGGSAGDPISGTSAGDAILGTSTGESITGGAGDDMMAGGLGSDTFKWSLGDQGTVGTPAADVIKDFTLGIGGDALDLKDLLSSEHANAGSLDAYLDFSANGSGQTLISVHAAGAGSAVTQTITLENVQYAALQAAAGGTSDSAIITKLLADGNLKTDV